LSPINRDTPAPLPIDATISLTDIPSIGQSSSKFRSYNICLRPAGFSRSLPHTFLPHTFPFLPHPVDLSSIQIPHLWLSRRCFFTC
ncbi:hypothetical protein, partial [Bacteroides thetaiotaomicron]|uniref:hypothetical protein n=1 Tax=Bacteroides thetaiotaomicron TaxID=818 RepID=UPI001A910321